jgi:antitoxin (DNA-binding transcriptional repressor) of toxin-antitoxin stability system
MPQIDIDNPDATLPEVVEAALKGGEVILAKNNQPVAKVVAISPSHPYRRHAGSAKGLIHVAEDFDEPLRF